MTNYVQRTVVGVYVVATIFGATSIVAETNRPSEAEMLKTFQQTLLLMAQGAVSELELSSDIKVIGESLTPLIAFTQHNHPLRNTLINCLITLITTRQTITDAATITALHNEALIKCQEEFIFFCSTTEQYDTINQALNRLRLYYEPLNSVFILAKTNNESGDTAFKVASICVISAAAAALIYFATR